MSAPERLAVDYRIDRARLFASLRHWPAAVWLDSNAERRGDGAHDLISACPTVTLQQRQER
ncbi:MAG TPA: aminodeoxychorismate synthase component I, partial [Pseudomonadales bacterium]|nr:aminodeoxychorismate synthase component I [Pseudomonadales bacterium]